MAPSTRIYVSSIATFFLPFFISYTSGNRHPTFFFYNYFHKNSTFNRHPTCWPDTNLPKTSVYPGDIDALQFALNLEFLESEFFLFGALGHGLDRVAPQLAHGGPRPRGARRAKLDPVTRNVIEEFGYQEVGHLRAIQRTVGGFPRPKLDLSPVNFAKIFNEAFGYYMSPPIDPYNNTVNYLLASYIIPYMGLVGYVGANPNINGFASKRLLAGLLGVESGQDAIIRAMLYQRAAEFVEPYHITVAEFTTKLSAWRNRLAGCGIKDEGIIVPLQLGAENRTRSNILSADADSLSYTRTPAEILRVVYGTWDEHMPGGFYPHGGNGKIAKGYLK